MSEQGFVQLVQALAWPVAACVMAIVLRAEIRAVLARLAQLKVGSVEANFSKDLDKLEAQAAAESLPTTVPPTTPAPTTTPPTTTPDDEISREDNAGERIARLAAISPRAAVTEAWLDVERATMEAANAAGIPVPGRIAGERVVEQLASRGLVAPRLVGLYRELRSMRNKAAHAAEIDIGADDAVRYANLATVIAASVRAAGAMNG
ncbi:MAG: hypothetical protein K8T90_12085 [Planctomycetes bacterium]|nr:hypothetical protein [Planctomycetota bacterium]